MPRRRRPRSGPNRTPSAPPTTSPTAIPAVVVTEVVATEVVVSKVVLGKLAAYTARHTDGVARLEPGVAEMVSQLGRWGREQATGRPELPHEGVHVQSRHDGVHVHLDIATAGRFRAADVAHRLRDAVAAHLTRAAGVVVAAVTVTVLDVDFDDGLLTDAPEPRHRSEYDR